MTIRPIIYTIHIPFSLADLTGLEAAEDAVDVDGESLTPTWSWS